MDCGVPFCHQGCPLSNLIPEWNDLVHRGDWQDGVRAPASHEQLPRVHGQALPRALRGGMRPHDQRRRGHDQGDRARDRRARARRGLGRARSPPAASTGHSVGVVGSGPGRPRLRPAARARRPRGDGVRARRSPGRAAALRHPRLQARQEDRRPARRAARGRGRDVRLRRRVRRRRQRRRAARDGTTRSCSRPAPSGTAISSCPDASSTACTWRCRT